MGKRKVNNKSFVRVKTKYDKNICYKSGDYFEVEAIRDRKGTDENPSYLIKWTGWPEETNTWEPLKNIKNVKHLIYEFERTKNPERNLEFLDNLFSESEDMSFDSEPEGDIEKDQPQMIKKIRKGEDNKLRVKIDWIIRKKNGVKPVDSWVEVNEFKEKNGKMLVEYYESLFRYRK